MASVKKYDFKKLDEYGCATFSLVPVKVGDVVGFKSDHEQYGRVTKIEGDRLHLHNPNGFGGDYLRYAKNTIEHAGDCWID